MTPDGAPPDLDCHHVTADPARSLAEGSRETDESIERMRRVRLALDRVQDELLQALASTVLALTGLSRDHTRVRDTLAEARRQHGALFHVRRAVAALSTTGRLRALGEFRDALTESRGRTWLDRDQPGGEGPTSWRTDRQVTSSDDI